MSDIKPEEVSVPPINHSVEFSSANTGKGMEMFITVMVAVTWLMGIVIAKGVWSTLCAIWFPPYAWYLVVEHIMQLNGLLAI